MKNNYVYEKISSSSLKNASKPRRLGAKDWFVWCEFCVVSKFKTLLAILH